MFDEQDLERELTHALSVSPSPDFESRVLRRVEATRRAQWPAGYRWFAAAAAVVIVAGTFYVLNRTPAVLPAVPVTTTVLQPDVPERSAPGAVVPAGVSPVARASERKGETRTTPRRVVVATWARPTVTARTASSAEPEVLVPPDQMDAVRRLVRGVNEGRIVAPAEPGSALAAPPTDLVIVPLVIDPIPVPPLEPGRETRKPSTRNSQ